MKIATSGLSIMFSVAMFANAVLATKTYATPVDTAEKLIAQTPNAVGVWESDGAGTIRHSQSGATCPLETPQGFTLNNLKVFPSTHLFSDGTATLKVVPSGDSVGCQYYNSTLTAVVSFEFRRDGGENLSDVFQFVLKQRKASYNATDGSLALTTPPTNEFEFIPLRSALMFRRQDNKAMKMVLQLGRIGDWQIEASTVYLPGEVSPEETEAAFEAVWSEKAREILSN